MFGLGTTRLTDSKLGECRGRASKNETQTKKKITGRWLSDSVHERVYTGSKNNSKYSER